MATGVWLSGITPAWAYLDSASTIMEVTAVRRARLAFQSLEARGFRFTAEGRAPVLTAILADRGYRTEIRTPEMVQVELYVRGYWYSFARGQPTAAPTPKPVDPFFALLGNTQGDPDGERGRLLLSRMSINANIVSLSRHEGYPVYVIGAQPGQLDRPQLWIDKELYVPVRWLVPQGQQLRDTRLYGYRQATTGPWFPERIEEWEGDQRLLLTVYTTAKLNQPLNPSAFTPPPS
ncbi:MAG: hypothetical protein KTR25_03510 [Myxococcales bacterium]|nr:hypothetical protein [Myxococcales bacterium]